MTDKMNLNAANARPSPPSITGEPGAAAIARATGGVGDRASSPARDNSLLPERVTLLSSGESRNPGKCDGQPHLLDGGILGRDCHISGAIAAAPAGGLISRAIDLLAEWESTPAEGDPMIDVLLGVIGEALGLLRILPAAPESGEVERLRAELFAAEDRYQRDCLGLNNEGDPIGGDPPAGWKPRAEKAEARIAELEAERHKLAYAICGGEDFPGLLDATPVEALVKIARDTASAAQEQAKAGAVTVKPANLIQSEGYDLDAMKAALQMHPDTKSGCTYRLYWVAEHEADALSQPAQGGEGGAV